MLTIQTPAGTIEVLDSIKAIPAKRYTAFNVADLDHSAVGSDRPAAVHHLGRLQMFLNGADIDGAKGEFNNYILCLNQNHNTGTRLLATVVHSIGGVVVDVPVDGDYSGIAQQLEDCGITQAQVEEACDAVRGKLGQR